MDKHFKVVIPTVGRSDYSILRNLIIESQRNKNIKSYIISAGSHHSKMFGETNDQLKKDKIKNILTIKFHYLKNNKNNTVNYFTKILIDTNKFLSKIKPHACIIMGDRYEMLAISLACKNLNIKIIHLCGGSITKGSHDNDYRYCISQLANLHFVETKSHRSELVERKINKKNILISGAPALENIKKIKKSNKKNILKNLKIPLNFKKIALFTYHPETTENENKNLKNLDICLKFLKKIINKSYYVVITYPNADFGYNKIIKKIKNFTNNKNCKIFKNLGHKNYYNLLKYSKIVIGNSSSGIIECASFKLPVINIGDRQKGRYCSWNVIHSKFNLKELDKAFKKVENPNFQIRLSNLKNPYDTKIMSKEILNKIYKNKIFRN